MWIATVHTSFDPQHSVFIAENTDVASPFLHLLPPLYPLLIVPLLSGVYCPCLDAEIWRSEVGKGSLVWFCFTHRTAPKGHGGLRLCLLHSFFSFGLRWVFVAAGLSLVATSRAFFVAVCAGSSLRWLFLLWSTGSRQAGFIFLDSESGDWKWDNVNIFFEF